MITLDDINSKREYFYKSIPTMSSNLDLGLFTINQAEFLRQLDPNGHKILDPDWYSDIWKEVPIDEKDKSKGTQLVCKRVERVAIAMQSTILSKRQKLHRK